jgi:hypothetical protein
MYQIVRQGLSEQRGLLGSLFEHPEYILAVNVSSTKLPQIVMEAYGRRLTPPPPRNGPWPSTWIDWALRRAQQWLIQPLTGESILGYLWLILRYSEVLRLWEKGWFLTCPLPAVR